MFSLGFLRFEVKCFRPRPGGSSSMTPKNPKLSKSTSSFSSWVSTMPENLNCKNRSSPFKSRSKVAASVTNRQTVPDFSDVTDIAGSSLSTSSENHKRNEDLLESVTQLRFQLEILKDALEERERIDAEKDAIIERLTSALQKLQSPDRQGLGLRRRQRTLSGGNVRYIAPRTSELHLTAGAGAYDDLV